jgi:ferredoxin-type protein NapH
VIGINKVKAGYQSLSCLLPHLTWLLFGWLVCLVIYLLALKILLVDLVNLQLDFRPTLFVIVATIVFTVNFIFARHIFYKYRCALGLIQSLILMANNKAMVIKFNRA